MKYDPNTVPASRRKVLVRRDDRANSKIQASDIKTPEELAFAIRFLTDHFLYKRSKVDGVKVEDAGKVAQALWAVSDTFQDEVGGVLGLDMDAAFQDYTTGDKSKERPISELGNGTVKNPFYYI